MTQTQKYSHNSPFSNLKNSVQGIISTYSHKYAEVFEALSRQVAPLGGHLLEGGHLTDESGSKNHSNATNENPDYSENRYSVLYTRNGHYHHAGCSSQAEAQYVLGMMMTDEYRIPVGIYDAKTDSFEWEMIGQYFHSQDPMHEQQSRLDEILTIARVLRRRDSSWQPGYLQTPSFFA